MSLLKSLEKLIGMDGQHQQAPQSHPSQGQHMQAQPSYSGMLGNNTPQARAYAHNPMMTGVDPAQFGYPADGGNLAGRLGVNRPVATTGELTLGGSGMGIQGGGQVNPGFIPMQGSHGYGTTPQMGAFGSPQSPQFNPQVRDNGFYWN